MSALTDFVESYARPLTLKWMAGDPPRNSLSGWIHKPQVAHWIASVTGDPPLSLSAEGATPDDAVRALAKLLVSRLEWESEQSSSKSAEHSIQAAALKDALLTSAAGQP